MRKSSQWFGFLSWVKEEAREDRHNNNGWVWNWFKEAVE